MKNEKFDYLVARQQWESGRELAQTVSRLGGKREEYKLMYEWVKFGKRPEGVF